MGSTHEASSVPGAGSSDHFADAENSGGHQTLTVVERGRTRRCDTLLLRFTGYGQVIPRLYVPNWTRSTARLSF